MTRFHNFDQTDIKTGIIQTLRHIFNLERHYTDIRQTLDRQPTMTINIQQQPPKTTMTTNNNHRQPTTGQTQTGLTSNKTNTGRQGMTSNSHL